MCSQNHTYLFGLGLLIGVLSAGCQSVCHHKPSVDIVQMPEPVRMTEPEALPFRLPTHDFGVENPPPTARTVEAFRQIRAGMSVQDVVKLCGIPDGILGRQLLYDLADGTTVEIYALNSGRVGIVQHGQTRILYDPQAFPQKSVDD